MRLWPRSLLGQTLLAVALALLVAQTFSAVLLWRSSESRREQAVLNAAAFRLLSNPDSAISREDRRNRNGRQRGGNRNRQASGTSSGTFALRLEQADESPLLAGEIRSTERETELRRILTEQGMQVEEVIAVKRSLAADPIMIERSRLRQRIEQGYGPGTQLLVVGIRRSDQVGWYVTRVPQVPRQSGALRTILLQTLLIYVLLVGLLTLLLRRITRPLKAVTARTESFAQTQQPSEPLALEGPEDIRRLIGAHNTMEARIAALLDEKDVMLGAIGHDLKTPLAALRVRIESVEDERERGRMADSIKDITRSLDDILSLARVGRSSEPPERAELSALTASVVEEFEDMGQPVQLGDTVRIVHPIYVTWLRRAVRNLIENAVRYGKSAEVSLLRDGDQIILQVDDHGPGIPEGRIEAMLEPFTRGEGSRNRDTGGAGLGLTLARAIAEQHGGHLVLTNRPSGGLSAQIRLPAAKA